MKAKFSKIKLTTKGNSLGFAAGDLTAQLNFSFNREAVFFEGQLLPFVVIGYEVD